jgi:hypothetical protein
MEMLDTGQLSIFMLKELRLLALLKRTLLFTLRKVLILKTLRSTFLLTALFMSIREPKRAQ